jgi:YHS domain-containing protein
MKKMFLMLPVAALVILAACNQKAEPKADASATEVTPAATAETVNVKVSELSTPKDYVCGMNVEEGAIADTTTYEGKLYGFCSKECKAEFVKEPAKYLAQGK